MNLSTLRAGAALLPLLFAVPAIAQQAAPPAQPAKPAEAPAAAQPAPAAPAQAAPQGRQAPLPKEFKIDAGGWKGGAVPNPQNQQFSHCDVSKPYDGGMTLAFTLNPNYLFNVAVVKQNWGLKEADKGKGRIRVDAAYDKQFDIVPVSPVAYVLPVGQDGELFQLLAKGSKAIVTTPKGEFTFALTGTGAALGGLRDCIETARKLIAQAQGNAGAGGQQQAGQQQRRRSARPDRRPGLRHAGRRAAGHPERRRASRMSASPTRASCRATRCRSTRPGRSAPTARSSAACTRSRAATRSRSTSSPSAISRS